MKPSPARAPPIGPLTPHLYTPTAERPVRAKLQRLRADTRVVPHAHPWGQLALSATGVIRVTAPHGSYIVPPSRAVWIPPGVEHAVTVIEEAELLTLYLHQPRVALRAGALGGRVGGLAPVPRARSVEPAARPGAAARHDARRPRRRPRARRSRASAASPRCCSTSCAAPRRSASASTCRRKSACAACARRCSRRRRATPRSTPGPPTPARARAP